MLFYVVGTILSISGLISGIVTGTATKNFLFCLMVWISTFLYVIIYFGIGMILERLDKLEKTTADTKTPSAVSIEPLSTPSYDPEKSRVGLKPAVSPVQEKWVCQKCGKANASYVGTCGCGQRKQDNV